MASNSGGLGDLLVIVSGHADLLVVVISVFLDKSFSSSSSSELASDTSWQEDGSGWSPVPEFFLPFSLLEKLLLREPLPETNKGF